MIDSIVTYGSETILKGPDYIHSSGVEYWIYKNTWYRNDKLEKVPLELYLLMMKYYRNKLQP